MASREWPPSSGEDLSKSGSDVRNPSENDDFEILYLEQEPQRRTPSMTDLDRSRESLSGSTEKALDKDSVSGMSCICACQ